MTKGHGSTPHLWAELIRLPDPDTGWVRVLRADGVLDSNDHPLFAALRTGRTDGLSVVADLSRVRAVSAAALGELADCAKTLADRGGRLFVTGADPETEQVLARIGEPALSVLPSVADVVAAVAPPGADRSARDRDSRARQTGTGPEDAERLRRQVRDWRARALTNPVIAQAQGIVQERYGLRDPGAAFRLLAETSQRHNVKLRLLSAAVVHARRPAAGDGQWFPGRVRRAAPRLDFLPEQRADRVAYGRVLTAILDEALTISETDMGNVQLVEPGGDGLRIERHTGLPERFVDYFDYVGRDGTSCALAAVRVERVTVTDVATDPVFSEEAREVILAAGSRGSTSTPLVSAAGHVLGMVSSHTPKAGQVMSAAQARALDRLGAQAGHWLDWHRGTVVLDALEDLHRGARTRPQTDAPDPPGPDPRLG